MTSVLRTYAQIPARIRYFITTSAYVPPEPFGFVGFNIPNNEGDYDPTFYISPYPGPIVSGTIGPVEYVDLSAGELLKDLGQQIVFTDVNNNHRAIYRRVQRVNGADSEGVGGSLFDSYGSFYVKVWDAQGTGVYVARTG